MTITGSNFVSGATVISTPPVTSGAAYVSPTSMTFDVNTTGGVAGSTDVQVQNPDLQVSNSSTLTWTA